MSWFLVVRYKQKWLQDVEKEEEEEEEEDNY